MSTTDPTTGAPEPQVAQVSPPPLVEPPATEWTAQPATAAVEAEAQAAAAAAAAPTYPAAGSDIVEAEVVYDTPTPQEAPPAQPQPQIVYVQHTAPPKKFGNRGLGVLLAILGAIIYALALAGGTWLLGVASGGGSNFQFIGLAKFWIPVTVFTIAFIVLVLLANRANWWAYILGSLFVAAAVYFGTIGLVMLLDMMMGAKTAATFAGAATSPFVIIATVLARESSMWVGSLIARRGRKVKAKNVKAKEDYEREAAERRAAAGYSG